MKRLVFALAFSLVFGLAVMAFAEGEEGTAVKTDWTSNIQVGGYIDVRPSFYWFTPENSNLKETHQSDIVFYQTGLTVTAIPFSAVRGVATAYYGEGPVNWANTDLGNNAAGSLYFDEGYLQLGDGNGLYARFGKYYIPTVSQDTFGMHFNLLQRNLYANPVAVGAGYNHKYFGVSAHLFNGRHDTVSSTGNPDNDIIDTYSAALNVNPLAMFERYNLTLGGFFLTDATETWGQFDTRFNGPSINYDENVPLYGGYLVGRFYFSDLVGLGVRGEYATTGKFDKDDYVNAKGDQTAISFMNAEVALLFWESVLQLGGKYESVNGLEYFATNSYYDPEKYDAVSYRHYGGFLRTNLMEELSLGLEYLAGADDEGNADKELQIQTRLDF